MIEDENQETRETAAVEPAAVDEAPAEVTFTQPEADAGPSGESPAAAQQRAESGDESPLERPEVQILGAFVGAFIVAKLLQRLFSRD